MTTTKLWAESLRISSDTDLQPIADYSKPYPRSAREVAVRSLILHGVAAAAYEVNEEPIIRWFEHQGIWDSVTPCERKFLMSSTKAKSEQIKFQWKQEAEWTLLWMIGKVPSLALPTHFCDTRLLADEIIPPLGDDVDEFIENATLRHPGALLAEDDRTYDLWCNALACRRRNEGLPNDLKLGVLFERRYAFEWVAGHSHGHWDDITCDA